MKPFILTLTLTLTFPFCAYSISLNDAYREYLNGDYEEALMKVKRLPQSDAVLYFLGLTYIKLGNYPEARNYLIKLTQNYARSQFSEQGLVRLADTYFLEGDLEKAEYYYKEIEKKYSSGDFLPLIYLRFAQIANKKGNWQDKKKYLAKIKEKYPQSPEAQFITTLENTEDFFTIQVGAFSNRGNAVSLKEEIASRYEAYIIEDRNQAYSLYKVRVGKFKNRSEAEKIYGKLIKQGYPARIIP